MRSDAQMGAPGAQEFALGRMVHEKKRLAPNLTLICTWRMVLGTWSLCLAAQGVVYDFLVQKARDFSPSSCWNSLCKYRISHSQFLNQNEAVQEEGKL